MLNNLSILTTRDLRNVCRFQLTFRFHMLFLIFKVHVISIQQIEQFWCLWNYKLFVPTQKQLVYPLFSSYSVLGVKRPLCQFPAQFASQTLWQTCCRDSHHEINIFFRILNIDENIHKSFDMELSTVSKRFPNFTYQLDFC